MRLRFLADQDVYQITVDVLRTAGHDVVTARAVDMQQASDMALLQTARNDDRFVLTRDKDFGALVFLMEVPAPGVVLLRMTPSTVETVHAELQRLLQAHARNELWGRFCVVEPHRYRIRQLPRS